MSLEDLSKEISYALRHAPWEYELEMDEEGWVPVSQLLEALNGTKMWSDLTQRDLEKMIEEADKKRHEIVDGKIRAFYGHSIPMKIHKQEQNPPRILYHGTTNQAMPSIMEKGLLPKSRQYVHLSKDVETAETVGKRRDPKPVILKVLATEASQDGIKFYLGNEKVWLADMVPAKYLVKMTTTP